MNPVRGLARDKVASPKDLGGATSNRMIKKLIWVLVIAVAVVVFWWWSRQTSETPLDTSDINQELEGLDVGDINEEFEQIDQELDTL